MKKLSFVIALATALGLSNVRAEVYPSHPITIIVPFAAGGPTDTLARVLSEPMRTALDQPIIVENVTGAGATIGVGRAAGADPDGYTLVLGNWSSFVGAPALYPVHFNVLTDFEPISLVSFAPLMLVGKNALPVKDAKELIAWLKANPDKVSAATVGAGTAAHLCGLYFQSQTGTRFQFVPYRGGAPAMQDLVAGQIDMMCAEGSQTLPYIRGGMMKGFAVMDKARWSAAPEIPTMDEVGVPGMHISFWHGLWAPNSTSKKIIAKLNAAIAGSLADPTVIEQLTKMGLVLATREQQTPAALAEFHKAETEKWWPIIKAADIKTQ